MEKLIFRAGRITGGRLRAIALAIFGLAMCALIACQPPASTNSPSSTAPSAASSNNFQTESQSSDGPVRDLSQDEAAGGHILRKHVGQTEEQLRERLQRERNITGASDLY